MGSIPIQIFDLLGLCFVVGAIILAINIAKSDRHNGERRTGRKSVLMRRHGGGFVDDYNYTTDRKPNFRLLVETLIVIFLMGCGIFLLLVGMAQKGEYPH